MKKEWSNKNLEEIKVSNGHLVDKSHNLAGKRRWKDLVEKDLETQSPNIHCRREE